MSGFTPPHISRFRDMLGARGMDMGKLAVEVDVCRRHLSEIVWGHWQGRNYWARIRACVTDAEWAELLHVENCATWNATQLAHGPSAEVWVMRARCGWCSASLPAPFVPCIARNSGADRITHGICPKCYAVQKAALDALRPRQVAADLTPDSFAGALGTPALPSP